MPAVSETVSPSVPSKKKYADGLRTAVLIRWTFMSVNGSSCVVRRNLSQYTVAELLGLTFQQIQKYEKGNNRISASRLWDYAYVLRVPIQFFFRIWIRPSIPVRRGCNIALPSLKPNRLTTNCM